MSFHYRARLGVTILLVLTVLFTSSTEADAPDGEQRTVVAVESLGVVTFDTGFMFGDTEVGGLSGITWDRHRDLYYAVSDDGSEENLARFYTVAIDLSDGTLDDGDVVFVDVTTLLDENGQPFAEGSVDLEGIVLPRPGQIFISSEGDADEEPVVDPFVNRFGQNGEQEKSYPLPAKFLPDGLETFGVRENLAFEGLSSSPDGQHLFAATETALAQDGPISGVGVESLSRILQYQLIPGRPMAEYVYVTGSVPVPPLLPGFPAKNGLVELAVLDNTGTLLAMERSFAFGAGITIRIYEALTQNATDVSGIDDLFDESTGTTAAFTPVDKRLIADLADLGVRPDNVEGMTFGPVLPDGRQTLILVSDNNFNFPFQITQFIALALETETVPQHDRCQLFVKSASYCDYEQSPSLSP